MERIFFTTRKMEKQNYFLYNFISDSLKKNFSYFAFAAHVLLFKKHKIVVLYSRKDIFGINMLKTLIKNGSTYTFTIILLKRERF